MTSTTTESGSPEMKTLQAKVHEFVKRLACKKEDRFIDGIIQGTLLKRGNPVRAVMFCNKPQMRGGGMDCKECSWC